MTGTIKTRSGKTFVFRNDHGFDSNEFWAWDIHQSPICDRLMTHKWKKLPKGIITLFDIENPPETVGFIPMIK